MDEKGQKKVVIIGGGIVGLSSAFFLQKLNYQVTVLESQKQVFQGTSLQSGGHVYRRDFTLNQQAPLLKTLIKGLLSSDNIVKVSYSAFFNWNFVSFAWHTLG